MRLNYVGLIGAVIAFISLAFPWWTLTITSTLLGTPVSGSLDVYPYRATFPFFNYEIGQKLWFGWTALALLLASGILGLLGCLRQKRSILCVAGALSLSSVAVFASGLMIELPTLPDLKSPNELFYFGPFNGFTYSMYLSFGFWLALTAGIMMLIASARERLYSRPMTPICPSPALEMLTASSYFGSAITFPQNR